MILNIHICLEQEHFHVLFQADEEPRNIFHKSWKCGTCLYRKMLQLGVWRTFGVAVVKENHCGENQVVFQRQFKNAVEVVALNLQHRIVRRVEE